MWLSKRTLLIGIGVGFGASCWLGRLASRQPMFEHFERFFTPIQPQQYFYPTASELVSYLQHRIEPGKNLALVGGASYFRGTGQNPSELWTLELQRRLKERYTVVNFAIDKAGFTSFAAVPFQIMAQTHPGMIYIANGSPISGEARDGIDEYKYIFWDAYYKGLFPDSVAKADSVQAARREELKSADGREMHLGKWIDSWTYSCDLWTYVGYKWFFTVWCDDRASSPFKPRREYHEVDDPRLLERKFEDGQNPEFVRRAEAGNLAWARSGFSLAADGTWRPDSGAWPPRIENWRTLFPADLKARTFIVFLRANPGYMKSLTAQDWTNLELTYSLGKRAFEREGYNVVQFRREDFNSDDFADAGHLFASGGRKVAIQTSARIAEFERAAAATRIWSHQGPLELALKLDSPAAGSSAPLIRLGHGAEIDEQVFLEKVGRERIRFGYSRGTQGVPVYSDAIAAKFGESHTARFSLSGLYPANEETRKYKTWMSLEFDGLPVWSIPIDADDQPLGTLTVAQDGQVVNVRRAPWPPRLDLTRRFGGAVVRLVATADVLGRSLPLVASGRRGAGDLLFAKWSEDGALSFGFDHWNDHTLFSPPIRMARGSTHVIEFQSAGLAGDSNGELSVRIDGKPFWRIKAAFYHSAPEEVYWGQNPIGASTAESWLQSGIFERLLPVKIAVPPSAAPTENRSGWKVSRQEADRAIGARVRFLVLPSRAGRSFPLAATGRSGAGDVLLMRWSRSGDLTFGYDHWNAPSEFSPPVALAEGTEHEVEFRLPALLGGKNPALSVLLDGKPVWSRIVPYHPARPGEIYWGENPIGATSSERFFQGGELASVVRR